MFHRYPDDADLDDFFDIEADELDRLKELHETEGKDSAFEYLTDDLHFDWDRASDLMEWLGYN